ncbi:hypothetical protein B296_00000368, partial [Ensete ventricosum]
VVCLTLRVELYKDFSSTDWLRENFDLLEERRATAHLRTLEYKKVVASREIKVGNLVL